uniref:NADH dehydrogenase subunit 6 n=1 Tax=Pulex irritans TaxID=173820 RepID=UPI0020281CFE|nr:NADH dehydrogenase subunit 6 [Pulex irritans]UPV72705.1 NADH dehydrogenase subunit 6 [Pulex irritans]
MKFLLMNFGLIYSMTFSFMNHPLSMGFMLMIQTIWISLIIGISSKTFWFSYILVITFLGGMLILFIYLTSLSPSENFYFSFNKMIILLIISLCMMIFILLNKNIIMNSFNNMDSFQFYTNLNYSSNLNKLYNFPNNMITILLIIYLFITLICVVKITNLHYGPLRKNF